MRFIFGIIIVSSILSTVSNAQQSCPQLEGKWECKTQGKKANSIPQTSVENINQVEVNNAVVYAVASLETQFKQESDNQENERSFSKLPEKFVLLQQYVTDGRLINSRNENEEGVFETVSRTACVDNSLITIVNVVKTIPDSKLVEKYKGKIVTMEGNIKLEITVSDKTLKKNITTTVFSIANGVKIHTDTSIEQIYCEKL